MRVSVGTDPFVRKAGDTITGQLIISANADPPVIINRPGGGAYSALDIQVAGTRRYRLGVNSVDPFLRLLDGAGVLRLDADMGLGKLTTGTVPLARMGTVVLDASTAVGAEVITFLTIQAGANAHRFYVFSDRVDGVVNVEQAGARAATGPATHSHTENTAPAYTQNATTALTDPFSVTHYAALRRQGAGGNDSIGLHNNQTVSDTHVHKTYSLTET